jgi:hypothetical protein
MQATIAYPLQYAETKARHIEDLLKLASGTTGEEPEIEYLRERAQDGVAMSLGLYKSTKQGWDITLDLLEKGTINDVDFHGHFLHRHADLCFRLMTQVKANALSFMQRTGESIANFEDLVSAIEGMTRLRDHIDEEWPRSDPEATRRRVEEAKQNGGLTLDELFANVAGVSEDEWRQRAEAHLSHSSGQGGM